MQVWNEEWKEYVDVEDESEVVCRAKLKLIRQPLQMVRLADAASHSLHDCANTVRAESIKSGNAEQQNSAENFVQLYNMQCAKKVSSHALRTMRVKNMSQTHMLPLAEDLQKLQSFLKAPADSLMENVKHQPLLKDLSQLARLTLTQLILFNRRRGGEAQRLLCENYQSRNHCVEEDIARGLSDLERKLLHKFVKISVTGKQDGQSQSSLQQRFRVRWMCL